MASKPLQSSLQSSVAEILGMGADILFLPASRVE